MKATAASCDKKKCFSAYSCASGIIHVCVCVPKGDDAKLQKAKPFRVSNFI